MADIRSEAIALAALFQSGLQIQRIAQTGYCDEQALATLIRSLVVTNPKTIEDIYSLDSLRVGFKQLVDSFGKTPNAINAENIETAKISLKLIGLEGEIEKNHVIWERLSDSIDALHDSVLEQYPDFLSQDLRDIQYDNLITRYSSLYQSLISPNFSKLLIYGDERHLSVLSNQEKIRALLLCGIRAVILWRQMGGNRVYLMFRRKAIVEYAQEQL